jgi:cyclopropane fatty-acyl-phospholipid synthase-like methyltransferase
MKLKWRVQKNEKKSKIQKSKNLGKNFWNKEYSQTDSDKFSLSENPSEDLQKFTRWLGREYKDEYINKYTKFIDAGCGNGRNSIWLSETFGAKGIGYDLSEIAIKNANQKKLEKKLENNLNFFVQNLNQPIKAENNSHDLVLDMVASHVLRKEEREYFKNEVLRVLKSGGYYFLKSLLLDDDLHAKKMIRDDAGKAGEENSYIHPTMNIFEHVPTENELKEFYKNEFEIEKIEKSFAHKIKGRANKRRSITMYLRKR